MKLIHVARIPRFRALVADELGIVWGFQKSVLTRFHPPYGPEDRVVLGSLPPSWHRFVSVSKVLQRLSRHVVYRMEVTAGGAFVCTGPRGIMRLGPGESVFRQVTRDIQGRRPISLCQDEEGRLYFGEYFSNPQRQAVRIFASEDDGQSWRAVHEFPAGQIRHVHGLEYDPYRKGIWVLTGDDGDEAMVGWTDTGFTEFRPVLQLGQQSRACSGICTPNSFLFGMDAPEEQNYIIRLDVATSTITLLDKVAHSVFFATQACGGFWMSTVVEPSSLNTTQDVHLYFSRSGERWTEVGRFPRDGLNLKLFQFPSAFLAKSPMNSENVFVSLTGTKGWDGDCLVARVEDSTK